MKLRSTGLWLALVAALSSTAAFGVGDAESNANSSTPSYYTLTLEILRISEDLVRYHKRPVVDELAAEIVKQLNGKCVNQREVRLPYEAFEGMACWVEIPANHSAFKMLLLPSKNASAPMYVDVAITMPPSVSDTLSSFPTLFSGDWKLREARACDASMWRLGPIAESLTFVSARAEEDPSGGCKGRLGVVRINIPYTILPFPAPRVR